LCIGLEFERQKTEKVNFTPDAAAGVAEGNERKRSQSSRFWGKFYGKGEAKLRQKMPSKIK